MTCEVDQAGAVRENLELACTSRDPALRHHGREALLALPRAWLMTRIGPCAEQILRAGSAWEWGRMIDLYRALDPASAVELADRAMAHPTPAVAETGRAFHLADGST